MQNIFLWLVDNVFVWLLILYIAVKVIEHIREQRIGQVVMFGVLGGVGYYFLKNPETVLQFVSNIIAKFFGGGA